MWFSQAEAQFRRARITAETTMYDYILTKLPEEVVMSVRALVSAIEADPVKQEQSYTLMKEALLGSYGKTKWQMAYSLVMSTIPKRKHKRSDIEANYRNETKTF